MKNDSLVKHLLTINETIMNQGCEIATFASSMAEFQAIKLQILQTLSFPINWAQKLELKGKRALNRTLSRKVLLGALKLISWCPGSKFYRFFIWKKLPIYKYFPNFEREIQTSIL